MRIASETVARICGVSLSYALRLAKALRFRLDRGKGRQRYFGARHVIGLMVLPVLGRAGVSEDGVAGVANMLGGLPSDELFEARMADGRSWILALGTQALPELLTLDQVRASAHEHADTLAAARLQFVAVDLKPLLADLRVAVEAAERRSDVAAE